MTHCPICNFYASFLIPKKDRFGQEYHYHKCGKCRFLFDKDLSMDRQALQAKAGKVYQDDYFEGIDSGWKMRGDGFVKMINVWLKIYGYIKKNITVLDYGGGNGYVTSCIRPGTVVFYYDKYDKPTYQGNYTIIEKPMPADVIIAVELVEHLTDIGEWEFLSNLSPKIFIFTTGLSDNIGDKELPDWEYLNPDAGHTALYSCQSLYLLARKYGFVYLFFPSISSHIFYKNRLLSKINFVKAEYFVYHFIRKIKKSFI